MGIEAGALDEASMGPEKKELLEKYVLKGYNLIYNDKEAVANMASRDDATKVENVAEASFFIGQKIDRSEQEEGEPPFPDDIKMLGGYHLVDKLIQFAEHKGAKSFSDEEKQAALKGAYQKYMTHGIKNRTIDPVALAQSAEQIQPGSIKNSVAGLPDQPAAPQGQPVQAEAKPPNQEGAKPPQGGMSQERQPGGLLNGPSPLEDFLNEQRK